MEVNEYLDLPYTRILKPDDEGQIIATIAELPGCMAHADNEIEALANLKEVQASWIRLALKANKPVPIPSREDELPSGKWVQRVPRYLHARLVAAAREEDISLNQLAVALLSEGLALRYAPKQTMRMAKLHHLWPDRRSGQWKLDTGHSAVDETAADVLKASTWEPSTHGRRGTK